MLMDPLRALLAKHRRHVEQSPGVGPDKQGYALAVLDDLERDLDALPAPVRFERVYVYRDGTVVEPGWFCPDAPLAPEDGGACTLGGLGHQLRAHEAALRKDGGEDAG